MAENVTQTQIVKENPEIEAYRIGLLKSAKDLVGSPTTIPAYQVAGLSPFEQQAMSLAQQGIGSYQPFLNTGTEALQGASTAYNYVSPIASRIATEGEGAMAGVSPYVQGTMGYGTQANLTGQDYATQLRDVSYGALGQAPGMYDPNITRQYMDPYQREVTANTVRDIQRQASIEANKLKAQGVAAGAYGGSRQAIAEQEFQRNINDTIAQTIARDTSQNYLQAQQAGMSAFEADRQRRLAAYSQAAQGLQSAAGTQFQGQQMGMQGTQYGGDTYLAAKQLGLGSLQSAGQMYGSLGDAYGNLGGQFANMGALGAQLGQEQSRYLAMLGGVQREQSQGVLEAQRQTELARQYEPYQRLGFLSDIYAKTPTSQSTLSQTTAPSAGGLSSALGSGIQAYALYQGMNNLWGKT